MRQLQVEALVVVANQTDFDRLWFAINRDLDFARDVKFGLPAREDRGQRFETRGEVCWLLSNNQRRWKQDCESEKKDQSQFVHVRHLSRSWAEQKMTLQIGIRNGSGNSMSDQEAV
jgi:hypothetical protein